MPADWRMNQQQAVALATTQQGPSSAVAAWGWAVGVLSSHADRPILMEVIGRADEGDKVLF